MNFNGFSRELVPTPAGSVAVRRGGEGPAVFLLHGYPETGLAWRKVAPQLTGEFSVIAADLPGYGDSMLSADAMQDGRFSKRSMARALADAMTGLGIRQFAVVGHDRGARAAYRLALDLPERVRALAVLDVVPILDMADAMTYAAARQMAHWFWLGQASTVPRALIGCDPDLYVRHIIDQWGGSRVIEHEVMAEYVRCMRRPNVLEAIAAEYRADELDLEHDRADRAAARRIRCPVLAVWARHGLTELFGDPLAIWKRWADDVRGGSLDGGHFMMEESPDELIAWLRPLLAHAFGRRSAHRARPPVETP
jgi:haloacetate dehalogenase